MPIRQYLLPALAGGCVLTAASLAGAGEPDPEQVRAGGPVQVSFLWHMHQPIYVPYVDPMTANGFFTFSVTDVHNSRFGPYTTWPADAIGIGVSMPYLGAQVSFSGSLMENLNSMESAGINGGMWNNWSGTYAGAQSMLTAGGNRRLEMVGFGYHHPLMPLIDEKSIRMQVRLHRMIAGTEMGAPASRGIFPPETAFSTRMIPALVAEGVEWVMVDNIHFDRASQNYPWNSGTSIIPPNRADQINPDPATTGGRWVQLNNLWAPSPVSVPFGYQPAYTQHVDPDTGAVTQMIAVPAARYEGNEDGRGGYGAFLYDQVMDAYVNDSLTADRPMLVLLHHDGDNFGGGSEAYYHHNFQNMVNWASADPDYDVTTVNDYLDRFPVPPNALIHIEDGSWAGADAGDPEFKKWLGGDVSAGATSPDINSWAALVSARNALATAEQVFGAVDVNNVSHLANVMNGIGTEVQRAWHWMLVSQASDYWYWDGTEVWDSNPTRGANQVHAIVGPALAAAFFQDQTPPTVFVPHREPYNPGALEWNQTPEPSDFEVWTLIDDWSGVASATLKWRIDADGSNPLSSVQNETYAGGPEVGPWQSVPMTATPVPTPAGVLVATDKGVRYGASITGQNDVLLDYYVEAVDTAGNVAKSDIMHVWVGQNSTTGGTGDVVLLSPEVPEAGQPVSVTYDPAGRPLQGVGSVFMHYGFNGWTGVSDIAMTGPDSEGLFSVTVSVPSTATEFDFVFNDGGSTWDNNGGQDWIIPVSGGEPGASWEIDGTLDAAAQQLVTASGVSLWAGLIDGTLYLATEPAGGGNDRFLFLAQTPGAPVPHPWAKSGTVAQWDAYLGNEADNGWAGWFDGSGTTLANGSVLESSVDLSAMFGAVPASVAVAVGSYATPDAGALIAQAPAGNADGNLDASEYLVIDLCSLTPEGCCPADVNADGVLDNGDIGAFVTLFLAGDLATDFTGDGILDNGDIGAFVTLFLAGC